MSREANLAAQQRLVDHVNALAIDSAVEAFADDAVDHDPAPGQGPGRAGFRDFLATLARAFPDARLEPEVVLADDDRVALAYTLTGTHAGVFQGIAATGRRITVRGMQIARFKEGKIVERWGTSDELGILEQLGATLGREPLAVGTDGVVH